jgi:phage gpG-like protein
VVNPTVTDDGIYIESEPLKKLEASFDKLRASVADLRPMFEQFASDFYKDQKRHFRLSGPGQYKDLSEDYKQQKESKWGHVYPILFASGRLASSLLSRNAIDSVCIIKRQSFVIGTTTPYAVYHHSHMPRPIIPRRPLWFFDEANAPMRDRWMRIVDAYLDKVKEGAFK